MAKIRATTAQNKKASTPDKAETERNCSFCGKSSKDAYRLIAGPYNNFICDECISVCVQILIQGGATLHLKPPLTLDNEEKIKGEKV